MKLAPGFFSSAGTGTPIPPREFHFGIASAFYLQNPYIPGTNTGGIPHADQISLVQGLGMDHYRIGFRPDETGTLTTSEANRMTDICTIANANNITILCMVNDIMFPLEFWNTTNEQQAYDKGYALMNGFVTNYGNLLPNKIYELSNEISLFRFLRRELNPDGSPSSTVLGLGEKESDYNSRLPIALAYIHGMEIGCKDADPAARTMFNTAGWAPTYMVERLFQIADSIDILAWHWYGDMQTGWNSANPVNHWPAGQAGYPDIVSRLADMFGKPIWITECNSRWDADDPDEVAGEQRQVDYFNEFYAICEQQRDCIGYTIYQLLNTTQSDGQYGIYYFPGLVIDPNTGAGNYEATITPRALATQLQTT